MAEGIIFDIQRYSVHDGPGIRTLVFLKGCPLRCIWCQNPEGLDPMPELAFFASKCIGCGECEKVCPHDAIVLEGSERILRDRCDRCGKCCEVCYAEALVIIGKLYSVEELLDVVLRDRPFYEASGGGVTVSGGEPMMQLPFLEEFLTACKDAGLHTVIETCGYFDWQAFEKLLPVIDIVYFDLKIIDAEKHTEVCGVDLNVILENAKLLVVTGKHTVFRVPLIPLYTGTPDNLAAIIETLTELRQDEVHLLPYHRLGESKLGRIDSQLCPLDLEAYSESEVEEFKAMFESANIRVSVGGS